MAIIPIIISLTLGVLPALFWLWFWLREDKANPEPKLVIAQIFCLGALSVIPAYYIEHYLVDELFGHQFFINPRMVVGIILAMILVMVSLVEEGLKFIAAYLGGLQNRAFNEPIDAMIYLITAALGFVAAENTLFIFDDIYKTGLTGLSFALTGSLRFIGPAVLHVVASAFLGGMIALSYYQSRVKQVIYFLIGFGGAVGLHTLFNYIMITSSDRPGLSIYNVFLLFWLLTILIILFFERIKDTIINFKIDHT